MKVRRLTRLTNALLKRGDKHFAHMALCIWDYSFRRPHLSLRTKNDSGITPAMAADLTCRPAKFEKLIARVDEPALAPSRPKRYHQRPKAVE